MDLVMKPWKTLQKQNILETPVFKIRKIQRTSAQSGATGSFYTLETPDWVNVVAITPDEQLVLIHQYRHGVDAITLEIPGGMVDPGEDPARTAARELREETGYTGETPILIGTVAPNPAIQTNRCHTYLIRNVRSTADLELEEFEEIETLTRPISEVPEMVRHGEIDHALVLNALYWYDLWQKADQSEEK